MDPTNVTPEKTPEFVVPHPNTAPGLGGVAANMAPNTNHNALPGAVEVIPSMPEMAPMGSPEQLSNPETQTGPMQSTPGQPVPAPDPQQPVVVQSTTIVSDDSSINASAPATAADDDLIEKEWVDQAKKIISSTKSDPHEQARLVAELMRDYVRKRYGKEVGKAPDD
ncbi:MAG: hypothetical protein LBQ11_00260 [Candidatus Nomurabacteria bacterium]|jgi:hypothetical protein|nr:hypothetical protein [Candidatus Nomurabacteria bacterium]